MNSRRQFILKSSLASTVLIATNPFNLLSKPSSSTSLFLLNNNKVIFLHTGDHNENINELAAKVRLMKATNSKLLLLHATTNSGSAVPSLKYDILLPTINSVGGAPVFHHITYKGKIKIGVLVAKAEEINGVQEINALSSWLKNEKKCHFVVCLSELGFKNKEGADDLQIAENSTHIDMILGGHARNICKGPYIARNKNKEEVIINSSISANHDFANIEVQFDQNNNKSKVWMNHLHKRNFSHST